MPYGVAGSEIICGLKKTATWGTPLACGSGDGLLILPSSLKRDAAVTGDDSLGVNWMMDGNAEAVKAEGDLPLYLRYDGLDVLLALCMGTAGAPAQQGGSAAYAYTYRMKKNLDGLFAALAIHMKNYVQEATSVKVAGLTIKGEAGKPVQVIAKLIACNVLNNSSVNTLATMANVTFPETANRVLFVQSVFRLNDQGGAALSDGTDKIYPNSFELSFQRKVAGQYTGELRTAATPVPQDLIDEPTNDGLPEIRLKLGFPRHKDNSRLLELANDTRKKADIRFTGGLIAGAYYRQFNLTFPHLQPAGDDVTIQNGAIPETLEYLVHGASAAPTGMSYTDPFWISGQNKRTTDPLA